MSKSALTSFKLALIDSANHHPEIKPHIASAAQDIIQNKLHRGWHEKMKTLISKLAESKKTKTSFMGLNENQIDTLFLSLAQSEDSKEHVLHVSDSTSLNLNDEDDTSELSRGTKEACWRI